MGNSLLSTATTCSRHRLSGAIHRACAACMLAILILAFSCSPSPPPPTCASPGAAGNALPRSYSSP
eukprot:scaffold99350_cov27-Phaeocystis_antarctica.AAC.1